jgi:hypothetical protein
MNNPFLAFFIFIVILFSYIHITAQWKTSNDLEIYESDYESPTQLQEVCAVKQPVIFKLGKDRNALYFFERFQASNFAKYDNLDIRIKDRQDYHRPLNIDQHKDSINKDLAVDSVPLSFRSARRLLTTDSGAKYFSENNHTFLEESGLDRLAHSLDAYLKPPLSAYTKYDIMLGSPLVTTPLRYHLESHRFIATTRGKIHVKLCPPKYSKIIPFTKDYENYEFWSPLNPWTTVPGKTKEEHKEILQKTKFLDVEVNTGDILFLPPYWMYSISFSGDPETTVATFTYDVAMNIAAQSKHWGLYYLQQNNIKNRPAKTLVLSEDGDNQNRKPADFSNTTETHDSDSTSQLVEPINQIKQEKESTKMKSSQDTAKREIVTNAGTYVIGSLDE